MTLNLGFASQCDELYVLGLDLMCRSLYLADLAVDKALPYIGVIRDPRVTALHHTNLKVRCAEVANRESKTITPVIR